MNKTVAYLFLGLCGCGVIALLFELIQTAFYGSGWDKGMSMFCLTMMGVTVTLLLITKAIQVVRGDSK